MRKIGMMLAWLVCTGMAQAGEYAYLVFVNQNNDTTIVSGNYYEVYELKTH